MSKVHLTISRADMIRMTGAGDARPMNRTFDLEDDFQCEAHWRLVAQRNLLNKTIVGVRYMSSREAHDMGWSQRPVVITLSDGSHIFASKDDEGNDGGALFGDDEHSDSMDMPVLWARGD